MINWLIELFPGFIDKFSSDLSPGRMFESWVLFIIVWSRLKPHLKKIEDRMAGLETAVKAGFNSGEERFKKNEEEIAELKKRQEFLENQQKKSNGGISHERTVFS